MLGWMLSGLILLGSAAPIPTREWPSLAIPPSWKFSPEPIAEEQFAYRLTVTVRELTLDEPLFEVAVNYQDETHFYRLRAMPTQLTLTKVTPAGETLLAEASCSWPPREEPYEVAVKRGPWRLRILKDGQPLLLGYDAEWRGGRCAYAASPGVEIEDQYQPLVPLYFRDDFMRTEEQTGAWEVEVGEWKNTVLSVRPDLSANPFAYVAFPRPLARAVTGYPFWSDYEFAVSVKAIGVGSIGLLAYYQDEENYLLFRWSHAQAEGPEGERRLLLCVREGKPTVLAAAPGGFAENQWYRLRLRLSDTTVQAFLDEELVFDATQTALGEGLVGLYAERVEQAFFDDAAVDSWEGLHDDFSLPHPSRWETLAGHWEWGAGWLSGGSREALAVTGREDWSDYTLTVRVRLTGSLPASRKRGTVSRPQRSRGAAGLVFGYRKGEPFYLLQSGGGFIGQSVLLRVENQRRQTLAQTLRRLRPGRWHQMRVQVRGRRIRAWLDDRPWLAYVADQPVRGRVGLWVDGGEAQFAHLRVSFDRWEPPEPPVTAQFQRENTMANWASPAGAWVETPAHLRPPWPSPLQSSLRWHKGDFFGDFSLTFRLRGLGKQRGRFRVVLNADGVNPHSGYTLLAEHPSNAAALSLHLQRQGLDIAQATVPLRNGDSPPLTISRWANYLLLETDHQLLLRYQDPHPLTGRKCGVASEGLKFDWADLTLQPTHLHDYTFSQAPTDWYVQTGTWGIADRWKCFPGWSWFSGRSPRLAVIWNKRQFSGDLTVEVYGAVQMDQREPPYYLHPSDLNLTICGDGRDLRSGYSFLFGGWNNHYSGIVRQGKVVARNRHPRYLFNRKGGLALFHRRWFFLKIEKLGSTLRYYLDNELLAEYTDPHPLPAGQLALWTWRNGMMFARVKVYYEEERHRDKGARGQGGTCLIAPLPKGPFTSSQGVSSWRSADPEWPVRISWVSYGDSPALRVENLCAGGTFGVLAAMKEIDLTQYPRLGFAYRAEPQTKINVHLRVRGVLYTIVLTGPDTFQDQGFVLGRIPNAAADGKWHQAEFDLLTPLRKLYPQGPLVLEDLEFRPSETALGPAFRLLFGNLSNKDYLFAGFSGNPRGAVYELAQVHFAGPVP